MNKEKREKNRLAFKIAIVFCFALIMWMNVLAVKVKADSQIVTNKLSSLMDSYGDTYWTKNGQPSSNYENSKYYWKW